MNQFEAAYIGDLKWFDMNKFDVDAKNWKDSTVLIIASYLGFKELAFKMVKNGANPNIQDDDGDAALTLACQIGCVETAFKLIENGAKLDIRNRHGDNALSIASSLGNKNIVNAIES